MSDLKRSHPVFIASDSYSEQSGGIRALYLVCNELNTRGFQSYLVGGANTPSHLNAPSIPHRVCEEALARGNGVAVYPEIINGNPWGAKNVVRFLLNRPGIARRDTTLSYGPDDLFLTFDRSHVPAGHESIDLFVPLVDRRYYFFGANRASRRGYVICAKRPPQGSRLVVPPWVTPILIVQPSSPKTHRELGEIYRTSRALVAYERTTAIYEALSCGCPVLCLSSPTFNRQTFQPRFGGSGLSWSADEASLELARESVTHFDAVYRSVEEEFPQRVDEVFTQILTTFVARQIAAPSRG